MRSGLSFAAFFSFYQDASMPLIVFSVDVTEPQIALHAMHGCREIAGFGSGRDSLARPVGSSFVIVVVQHGHSENYSRAIRGLAGAPVGCEDNTDCGRVPRWNFRWNFASVVKKVSVEDFVREPQVERRVYKNRRDRT